MPCWDMREWIPSGNWNPGSRCWYCIAWAAAACRFRWWTAAECSDGFENADGFDSVADDEPGDDTALPLPTRFITECGLAERSFLAFRRNSSNRADDEGDSWFLPGVSSRPESDSDFRWEPGDSMR